MILATATVTSPLGQLVLVACGESLIGVEFEKESTPEAARRGLRWLRPRLERYLGAYELRDVDDPAGAASRLRAYFAGDLAALDRQPVEMLGTPFQVRVWRALREIPVGSTESYGELAARINAGDAMRAVGAANGSNPIAVFVPCHRVIAADRTLHGYGGGLDRKEWLLKHEGARWAVADPKAKRAARRGIKPEGQTHLFGSPG